MLHKEGFKIIRNTLLILIMINIIVGYFTDSKVIINLFLFLSTAVFILILQFFRNPKRVTPVSDLDNEIIAPADGKVVVIKEVEENEYLKGKAIQVSIFMSPINVHVNRNPINGEFTFSKYHPGKFLVAYHPKSSELNERTTIAIKHKKYGEIVFRQIAGLLARRIVNYAKKGDTAVRGEDFGFIKFGSRVDLFLPLDAKINVNLEQNVRGGETILAHFNS